MKKNDIADYWAITNQLKVMEARRELVRQRIIDSVIEEQDQVHPGSTITTQVEDYNVQIQVKKGRQSVDRAALEQLIYDKGLWEECTRPQIDDSLIEQAFIEGRLTDEDLRSIQMSSAPQMAIKVERQPQCTDQL